MPRSPLQKVRGLERLQALGLPATSFTVLSPGMGDYLYGVLSASLNQHGSVSIRTDSNSVRGGSSPFLFMEKDLAKAAAFCAAHPDMWLIISEPVAPEQVLVQAHIYLDNVWGRWRLAGEANEQNTRSCREAVAQGTRSTGLRDIWELPHHGAFWARLRRLMLDAGLVNGEIAEVTICRSGRIVFWEV